MGLRGFSRGIGRLYALGLALTCVIAVTLPVPSAAYAPALHCLRLFEDRGPSFQRELPGIKRDPTAARLNTLKIAHYSLNTFNFFPGEHANPTYKNKQAVVQTILFEKPDILTLSEVMNHQTLMELARQLDGLYEPFMTEGNSEAGVAVLIRKSLPLLVELESHRAVKHWYMGAYVPLFTRDLVLVHLTLPGATRPLLTLGVSHFKAQKDNFKSDPRFKIKRSEQEQGALAILDAAANNRSSRARILMGDMNSDVRLSTEMLFLKEAGYQEALAVLDLPMARRSSHTYFPFDAPPNAWQTDAAFVSPDIAHRTALVGGYIAADRSLTGQALEKPRSPGELKTRGSDHRMIVIEIDIRKLR